MQGSFLRFYVHEGQAFHQGLVWEWLLMRADKLGIRGGSAFRAMAGFGRHHQIVESRFFDLEGSQVIEIEFVVTNEEAQLLRVYSSKLRRHRSQHRHRAVALLEQRQSEDQ
jgi:hypothetical protein